MVFTGVAPLGVAIGVAVAYGLALSGLTVAAR